MFKQESPPAWTQEAYRPPRSHSKSLLFLGGGSLGKKFFFQSEHVSSQIWCQIFSLYRWGGGSLDKKIFFPTWTCIKPNLVSKIFPFTVGGGERMGPSTKKFFFPVCTCIKPNLLSKIFPFIETGCPPQKSETWDPPWKSETPQKSGTPLKIWDPPKSETPPKIWDPPAQNLRPPRKSETWGPPPLNVNRQTPVKTVPSRRTTYAGGNE